MKPYRGISASFVALLACLMLDACSSVDVRTNQFLGVRAYPPTDPVKIEILPGVPAKPHDRLGEIILKPRGNPSVQEIETRLRQAAAQLGADAVVIMSDRMEYVGGYMTNPGWGGGYFLPEYNRVIDALAIRYPEGAQQ